MIIDGIRTYIRKCPNLKKLNGAIRVNVNYLDDDSTVYSIEEVPCEPIVKKYLNGDSVRQFQFILASREPYGPDVLQNINNSGFYEEFAEWIENENDIGNLPILNNNCEAMELKVLSPGYAFAVDEHKARYQIELRLKYYKKGSN